MMTITFFYQVSYLLLYISLGLAHSSVYIHTFDGYKYPFAGYGEYVLLRSRSSAPIDVMLQIRTDISPHLIDPNTRTTVIT